MILHNKLSRAEAIQCLNNEKFARKTLSFYRYIRISDTIEFRNKLFAEWSQLNCFGRIYIAGEGINAQMSVPEYNVIEFLKSLNSHGELNSMPIKWAVEDDGKSFYKLTIKVRDKIVADGLDDSAYDVTDVGNHLSPIEFHELVDSKNVNIVDMRNHYESEVGKFKGAFCPDADTFRDAIKIVENEFSDEKNKKILLYCTGGIRCEKASAYLKSKGFLDVNQLQGGIVAYASDIKQHNIDSKFTGKNFVFDQRLGESIDGKIIARCHQCGQACDTHTNCANDDCHLLFIQCKSCAKKYHGCCSEDCAEIIKQPLEIQRKYRKSRHKRYAESKIFKSRLRPQLMEEIKTREKQLKNE